LYALYQSWSTLGENEYIHTLRRSAAKSGSIQPKLLVSTPQRSKAGPVMAAA
jgi:hypothetical protein